MPKLISKKFNLHIAEQFKEGFNEASPNQFYVFYSRINPWANESAPPTPSDTVQYTDYDVWRGMLGLKRISNNDVTFSVPKYNWTANTVYSEYTPSDDSLFSKQFYAITANNNVYKCLFNNDGAQSTVKPTGTSTTTITTSDGYKWKFMYNITTADMIKFASQDFIPVKTLEADDFTAQWDVQQAAANGSIPIYDVTAGGSSYLVNKGTVAAVVNSSIITLANTASGVDDVYSGSTIFISSGLGSGQIRQITDYNGTTKNVTVNTAFNVVANTSSTYHVGPYINITGDGSGATAYANVSSGAITKVTAINVGSGYSYANVVVSANPSYGSGAAVSAYLAPPGGHGSDPVRELGGTNVTLNVQVDGVEGGAFAANNDFRIYGIVRDPLLRSTGKVATNNRYNQATRLTLTSVSGSFLLDEFVSGGTSGAYGRVIEFANTNGAGTQGTLKLTEVYGSFSNTETVTANSSSVTGVIDGITLPDILPYKGRVLHIVNQEALQRDPEQKENITITVKF